MLGNSLEMIKLPKTTTLKAALFFIWSLLWGVVFYKQLQLTCLMSLQPDLMGDDYASYLKWSWTSTSLCISLSSLLFLFLLVPTFSWIPWFLRSLKRLWSSVFMNIPILNYDRHLIVRAFWLVFAAYFSLVLYILSLKDKIKESEVIC